MHEMRLYRDRRFKVAEKSSREQYSDEHKSGAECRSLFPLVDPYASDTIAVEAGHRLHYEQCGNPRGAPVVVLHGGPGSGCSVAQRRFFDPLACRIVLFDQRGAGRSTPAGGIAHNDTGALIADLEALRTKLGIERWLVFGGSWGSTLALAYAQAHPQHVSGLVLRGVFLCRAEEIDWYLYGARRFVPAAWRAFASAVSPYTDLLDAYHRRVFDGAPEVSLAAARAWNTYERALMAAGAPNPCDTPPSDAVVLARCRIQLHYLVHRGFSPVHAILEYASRLHGIPCVIVQGRFDLVCPPTTAFELAGAYPSAELVLVESGVHSAFSPAMADALIAAAKRLLGEQK